MDKYNLVPFPEYEIFAPGPPAGNVQPPPSYELSIPQQPVQVEKKTNVTANTPSFSETSSHPSTSSEDSYWKGLLTGVTIFTIFEMGRVLLFGL